jgi:3',5'-cyclic AMP phosphodiesterase CpdA
MRTLVHLSDLHFGRTQPDVVDGLRAAIASLAPDVVAVSGDLTQRARRAQFREAKAFLDSLPHPLLVVPGNHDVPLFNVFARFLNPLGGYRRHITSDLQPLYRDDEMVVVGGNTTRSLTIGGGAMRQPDMQAICSRLRHFGEPLVKVVVSHHPFDTPYGAEGPARSTPIAEALLRAGADVFLTGHLHVSYTGHTATRYSIAGRSAIVVEAGTATSTRVRGEPNAFNVLEITPSSVAVTRFDWDPSTGTFGPADNQRFVKSAEGWGVETTSSSRNHKGS